MKENTYSLTQHTDLTRRNSTGMSNGLLDALKTTKKEANTHTHTHRKCVKMDMKCVKRRCGIHTNTHKLHMNVTDRTDQTFS